MKSKNQQNFFIENGYKFQLFKKQDQKAKINKNEKAKINKNEKAKINKNRKAKINKNQKAKINKNEKAWTIFKKHGRFFKKLEKIIENP